MELTRPCSCNLQDILNFSRELALRAGELALRFRPGSGLLNYELKSADQMVSKADPAIEKLIRDAIAAKYPGHLFWGEETAAEIDRREVFVRPCWIVDPIDGTANYVNGHNHAAISIAFAEAGQVRVGVVYLPFVDEIFMAVKGCGARLNGRPIFCRNDVPLEQAIIAIGRPNDPTAYAVYIAQLQNVLQHCFDIRRLGACSADICWIACGRLHGYWESVKAWDMAAACLIAREAGVTVGNLRPLPDPPPVPADLYSEGLLVATPLVYERLAELLRGGNL